MPKDFIYFGKVVAVATVLSAATWVGLPILKANAPDVYQPIAQVTQGGADMKEVGEKISEVAGKAVESGKAAGEAVAQKVQETVAEVVAAATPEDGTGTNETANGTAEPDAFDPMAALNPDPGYPWGIVVTNSFFYDRAMTKKGILPGGTVVACKDWKSFHTGNVVECLYMASRIWGGESVFIYESDLVTFDGTYEKAPRKDRDLLIEYCKLYGRLEDMRAQAHANLLNRNPHLDEYRAAAAEYQQFNDKIRVAKQKYDVSTGSARMKLGDELRKYKYEQTDINSRYKAAKEKYNNWKAANVDSQADRIKTPEMLSIESAMERMRPEVQQIVPGL